MVEIEGLGGDGSEFKAIHIRHFNVTNHYSTDELCCNRSDRFPPISGL
jgi:hypothetical protein